MEPSVLMSNATVTPLGERHLSPEQLAERLGVPVRTVYAWRQRVPRKGPRGIRVGRYVRYRLADVQAWEEALLDPDTAA
jgi:excisionase family DNA binding protein